MIKIKRPILIFTIGYLIGIIYGLYFKKSIALVFTLIFVIIICIKKLKINYRKLKILRYLKIIIKVNVIVLVCICAIISNTYTLYLKSKYESFYKQVPSYISAKAVIISEKIEKEYKYEYIIKIKEGKYKNKKFILSTKKDSSIYLEYGDLIKFEGEYVIPNENRNYKGFNYREYLKSKKIYGTIKSNNISVIEKDEINDIFIIFNNIRNSIKNKSQEILSEETSNLLIGILLGDKNEISEEIIENFKTSNLLHILSVSGAHTSYIILGISYILNKSKISKKSVYLITIIILILFMGITNFTPSVIRACLMGILLIGSNSFYCKADTITSISLSLLISLIINPFSINDIGLQLSYLGTIGIILFSANYRIVFEKIKINKKISKLLSVTFGAQTMIMPIMVLKFNTISLTFFISNLIVSPILGFIMIFGIITIIISFISCGIASVLGNILNLSLKGLIYITQFSSKIPFSNILIKTPTAFLIVIIYFFIFILNYMFKIYISNNKRLFQKKIKKSINYKNIIKLAKIIIISIIVFNIILYRFRNIIKNLKIYFIDVGQGDCCLIVTPNNKKVLVDGGEGKTDILLSYLLDRRIKTIDYIIISHFDSDHCNGLIEVIENLKVKNIIISDQAIFSEEYKNIAKIINKKQINVINVKQGDKIKIEKNVQIDILYPTNPLEYNDLNNNSIVAKLKYNSFSILFTGDIESSEQNIIDKYYNTNELKSNIIKISHHGSKTSSSKEFLNKVNPQIALIGAGQNNKFGHPSKVVLERLESINCKIYRTDINGEIQIRVNKKGKLWINKRFK